MRGLDPWFVAFGRAAVAGVLASGVLRATRAPRPTAASGGGWRRRARRRRRLPAASPRSRSTSRPSAHGAVVVAVLPAMTAVFAVLRAGERPPPLFWVAAAAGLLAVLAFAASRRGARGARRRRRCYLLAAVVLCGLGYAEGGALARELGGARTICWALVLALPGHRAGRRRRPRSRPAARAAPTPGSASPTSTAVSMFLGFFAWYAGLARGGVARVGPDPARPAGAHAGAGRRSCSARPSAGPRSPPRSSCSPAWSRRSARVRSPPGRAATARGW